MIIWRSLLCCLLGHPYWDYFGANNEFRICSRCGEYQRLVRQHPHEGDNEWETL